MSVVCVLLTSCEHCVTFVNVISRGGGGGVRGMTCNFLKKCKSSQFGVVRTVVRHRL